MRGGILRRLLITYIVIVAIIVALLSLGLAQFLKAYFFQDKQKELLTIGRHVETEITRYRRGDLTRQQLVDYINTVGLAANARIIVVDSEKPGAGLLNNSLGKEFENILVRVMNGETVVKRQQFAAELNTYVVVVGMPTHPAGIERDGRTDSPGQICGRCPARKYR